jgi:hypothetical protein
MQRKKIADCVSSGIPGLCYFPTHMKTKSFNKNTYKHPTLVVKSNEINAYRLGYFKRSNSDKLSTSRTSPKVTR